MKDLRLEITINASVKDLFWYTLDPKNTPKWINDIKQEKVSEWPSRLGTEYQNSSDGKEWSNYILSTFDEPTSFTLSKSNDGYNVRYVLKSLGPNRTRLEYYEWMDDGELEAPFDISYLQKLKSVIESELAHSPSD